MTTFQLFYLWSALACALTGVVVVGTHDGKKCWECVAVWSLVPIVNAAIAIANVVLLAVELYCWLVEWRHG